MAGDNGSAAWAECGMGAIVSMSLRGVGVNQDFVSDTRGVLIQKLLKTDENLADLLGPSKIGDGIGN
jgi:hypothetical protein